MSMFDHRSCQQPFCLILSKFPSNGSHMDISQKSLFYHIHGLGISHGASHEFRVNIVLDLEDIFHLYFVENQIIDEVWDERITWLMTMTVTHIILWYFPATAWLFRWCRTFLGTDIVFLASCTSCNFTFLLCHLSVDNVVREVTELCSAGSQDIGNVLCFVKSTLHSSQETNFLHFCIGFNLIFKSQQG